METEEMAMKLTTSIASLNASNNEWLALFATLDDDDFKDEAQSQKTATEGDGFILLLEAAKETGTPSSQTEAFWSFNH